MGRRSNTIRRRKLSRIALQKELPPGKGSATRLDPRDAGHLRLAKTTWEWLKENHGPIGTLAAVVQVAFSFSLLAWLKWLGISWMVASALAAGLALLILIRWTVRTRIRRYACSIVVFAAVAATISRVTPASTQERPILTIAVAQFDGPATDSYGVTNILLRELRSTFKDDANVRISPLDLKTSEINGGPEARSLAGSLHADLLIWGWYAKTAETALINAKIEWLRPRQTPQLEDRDEILQVPIQRFESFDLQLDYSKGVAYLAAVTAGLAYVDHQDWAKAIMAFSTALSLPQPDKAPCHCDVLYLRSFAHKSSGNVQEAVADLDSAIASNPTPEFIIARAEAKLALGRSAEALSELNRLIDQHPDNDHARIHRGWIHYKAKDHVLAVADFASVKVPAPDLAISYYFAYGRSLRLSSRARESLPIYERALRQFPQDFYLRLGRANARHESGDYLGAVSEYTSLINDNPPENWAVFGNRGNSYMKLGRYSDAAADYSRAVAAGANPSDFSAPSGWARRAIY